MANQKARDPMLDIYILETNQLVEELEQSLLNSEKSDISEESINEIFRIMHTIKGSSGMMLIDNVTELAHSLEDLFYFIRANKNIEMDYSRVIDIVLEGLDFIKGEVCKIDNNKNPNGDPKKIIEISKCYLEEIKANNSHADMQNEKKEETHEEEKYYICFDKTKGTENLPRYKVIIYFEEESGLENIRAFTIVHELKDIVKDMEFSPESIMNSDEGTEQIRKEGFKMSFSTDLSLEEVNELLERTPCVKELKIELVENNELQKEIDEHTKQINLDDPKLEAPLRTSENTEKENQLTVKQSSISVGILKLDKLMDLVGELVISEAMVTRNPELNNLQLDGFHKAARQLRKITNELQDAVMSIRMVPLASTFQKVNRIVRDMSRKLEKEIELEIRGEETEVDKNIIEHLSDPLMHIVRNSMDHGIETVEERLKNGKPSKGKITLEAKNAGGDVWIIIKDDGKGLDKDKILQVAQRNGLLTKPEHEYTEKEIYSLIFLPGFSTKDKVTEFSGRGVGMDVVSKGIEKIGGTVLVDSIANEGTTISIKIPLTLAIIDGMTIKVGENRYTVPITSIRESFRMKEDDVVTDPDGNEMVMIRGQCYPILRLHQQFNVNTKVNNLHEGIIMMIENDSKSICLFADSLLGEQQVVVKPMPKYISNINGIAGCTLLGDGNISLILDISGLININYERR